MPPALVAGLMVAFNPLTVYVAVDARYYANGASAFGTVSSAFFTMGTWLNRRIRLRLDAGISR